MPRLSIIIPTFNSSGTIDRCLQSIAVQTFTDYEVILQDGSPTDETARAIESFQETHRNIAIRLYRERDRGVYDAMNKAMANARGEWLYFLGSDDELFDERTLATVLTAQNTADCDVIYGNVQSLRIVSGAPSASIVRGRYSLWKFLHGPICHQALFYRTSFAGQIGEYNTDYVIFADQDFTFRCWAKTRFRYIDTMIAKFHGGGLSDPDRGLIDERFRADFERNVLNYFDFPHPSPFVDLPGYIRLALLWVLYRCKGTLSETAIRRAWGVMRCIGRAGRSA